MFKIYATEAEKKAAQAFVRNVIPVTFSYDDQPFPQGFTKTEAGYLAPDGKLLCSFPFTFREDAAAVEWLPRFKNLGTDNTAQVRDVCALDYVFPTDGDVVLYYLNDYCTRIGDFSLLSQSIGTETFELSSDGSFHHFPFFNLHTGSGGVMFGLGFTGLWKATFTLVEGGVHVVIRIPETDFYMYPGESLRNILTLTMFWEGDLQRSFNRLRNYLVNYYIPKNENGEPFPPICCFSWGGMKTHNHLKYIKFLKENNIRFDAYWMDAGWFGPDHETDEFQDLRYEDWAYNMGEWSPNRCAHPDGLKPISDAAKDIGMDLLVWFAPHTGNRGIGWHVEHPEWSVGYGTEEYNNAKPRTIGRNKSRTTIQCILNHEIPEAHNWLLDKVSETIKENNIRWYREDIRSPRIADKPNRVGTGAMLSVQCLYDFWDELRRRVPGLQIDNCSGGATRVDLETLSRSYVLWRSDYNCYPDADPIGSQVSNHGIGHFVPLVNGAPPILPGSNYTFFSGLYGGMTFGLFHVVGTDREKHTWFPDDYPVAWHKQMIDIYQLAKPYLSGNFYPLTPCTESRSDVMSYQFERPDLNGGLIFGFFRPECEENELTVTPVLEPANYTVTDVVTGEQFFFDATAEKELTLHAKEKPDGILLHYQKQ